ncbi:MAG: hypothetical protein MJE77_21495 [Proteobacteria bacterium]|nr:hypothetical protein [Pseudomonadota bacterium]
MKKLVFAAFLSIALMQLGTGCIILVEDDDATLDVTWTLIAGDPQVSNPDVAACRAGETIEVVSTPTSSSNDRLVDLFDCDRNRGLVSDIPYGTYEVHINLYDGNPSPSNLIAQSDAVEVSLDEDRPDVDLDFSFTINRGQFFFTWSITENTASRSCADVGGDTTALRSELIGGTFIDDDLYDCSDFQAHTPFLPLGSYRLQVSLLDGQVVLGDSLVRRSSLDFGNHLNDLGNLEFAVVQ